MLTDLNYIELREIYGGSQKSYENGKKAGEAVRDFIDDLGAVGTVISIGLFIFSRGKIRA